jgi:hypothetical protein
MRSLLALAAAAAALVGLASADPCFDVLYADKNYGECCGSGNFKLPGHQNVCQELQKERRAEGDAKNIDFHKEPADSKVRAGGPAGGPARVRGERALARKFWRLVEE